MKTKDSLVTEVYTKMKHRITSGSWLLGSKLPSEEALCADFGVSRNTVRAALQKLNALGMIETRKGSGSYVARTVEYDVLVPISFENISRESVLDILEFRKTIEVECAYYAAIRRSEQDVKSICEAAQNMLSSTSDHQQYSQADLSFHLSVATAAKNEIFYLTMKNIEQLLQTHFNEMNSTIGSVFSANDHWNIYVAIKEQKPELAKALMSQTIERSIYILNEN